MTEATEVIERFEIDDIDCTSKQPHTIRVECDGQEWLLTSKKGEDYESHDPMDRVGGPFHIHCLCTEGADRGGEHWFLFFIVDSYFPSCILVRGDNIEDAYENFVDWLGDTDHNDGKGNYCMIVDDEDDLKQLATDEGLDGVSYTSYGVPVQTENIKARECTLKALEF